MLRGKLRKDFAGALGITHRDQTSVEKVFPERDVSIQGSVYKTSGIVAVDKLKDGYTDTHHRSTLKCLMLKNLTKDPT